MVVPSTRVIRSSHARTRTLIYQCCCGRPAHSSLSLPNPLRTHSSVQSNSTTPPTIESVPGTATHLYYDKFGRAADVLKLGKLAVPMPTNHQVLIQVHAVSIYALDCKRRNGDTKQLFSETLPIRVGYECSGVVVGEEVTQWRVGQEVIACVNPTDYAATRTYIAVDDDSVALKPSALSHRDAAAIPMASVTAYQVLKRLNLKPGGSIVIAGSAGGHVFQAGRIVTTASVGVKTTLLQSIGVVDHIINYREAAWETKYMGDKFERPTA
ncbi:TPA: LOW QUALITY PROTEIN: hypothetical protein N0F65_007373 [Lagenidium giganteum]|uniref:Alcohol dehydrogenase-like N-terminal domain-containing protein n=1 Tax=Lagenidium giganteum TaxID=4803 RepID=A0AAV2YK72_9STRA|nr:TPA: LOW QUALITY PROTEIN: hypothetical protein N0F65_007373 [Lagenidium giganteum]